MTVGGRHIEKPGLCPAQGDAQPAQPKGNGEAAPAPPVPGQVLAARDIKGTITRRDASEQCGVPLDKISAAAMIPGGTDPGTQVKSLKDLLPGCEVQTLRDAAAGLQK